MAECFRCGQEMADATGCADDRTIMFADGQEADPIPHGEANRDWTYQEMVEDWEQQIKNDGRGKLGPEHVREELEEFKERWDAEAFNNQACHDCGVEPGKYHHPGCDSEECPRCKKQYLICDCATTEKETIFSRTPS